MMPSLHHHTSPSSNLPSPQTAAPSHAMAFVVAGGVVALALAWFFALRPTLDEYRRVHAVSLQELQDRLIERRSSFTKLLAVDEKFSSITAAEQEKLEAIVPNEIGVSDLIANIEAIVRLSDLTLVSVGVDESWAAPLPALGAAPDVASVPPGVQVIPIQVRVDGNNYLTLQQLLQRVETNIRLLDVPTLTFEAQGDGLTLSLLTYAYRPPQVVQ